MKKYKFNWLELKKYSNRQPEAILILTYALTKSYNYNIAKNAEELRKLLFIEHIPNRLFQYNLLKLGIKKQIISRYTCKEPQSYFICDSFLTATVSLKHKIEYLYVLSKRAISADSTKIPKILFDNDYSNNPFIRDKGDYYDLYFEYTKSLNLTTDLGDNTQW